MAGFLYYVPGKSEHVRIADLAAVGLGYAFERGLNARGVQRGPDGQGMGVVVAEAETVPSEKLGFWPDRQTWRKVPGLEAWVGFYPNDRPQPQELLRKRPLPGHWVELADRQQWLIPIARAVTETEDNLIGHMALPTHTALDDEGNWVEAGVKDEYEGLWRIATGFWDQLIAAVGETELAGDESDKITFDFAGLNDAALTILQANYRVGKVEVILLNIFDGQCVSDILYGLVDWPTAKRWLAGKAGKAGAAVADGSSTAAGQAADTEPTGRPS